MAEHSDDLDQLLDSALDDFQSLNLTSSAQRGENNEGTKMNSSSMASEVQGLGMGLGLGLGLPDLKRKTKGKQKVSKESHDSHVSEALEKLREQTREAVEALASAAGPAAGPLPAGENLGNDAMMEDWVKQFEELAGSQDMESIVETMMQQLLSKEVLHEPMKEIGERYPKWLVDNKDKLSSEDFQRFSKQYGLIKELNIVYEAEPSNFNKIVDLMQKMQDCGQPPDDIVQELAPDFDLSSIGQISPEMLESQPQQNCCIM